MPVKPNLFDHMLSSGSSLQSDAVRLSDYIQTKASDLDKAKLALALLESTLYSFEGSREDAIYYTKILLGNMDGTNR